ncbi:hypothetical protein [Alloactinosynnema sp. L-07]|uniref:hypothetical protein n=1 Tax=Alloactinosynnema sp. L-07 TaxID=1653480 RepID=UPI00065F092B|nr:hypothetical protein [Alloactinosynnema sp. L-07]CRK57484.1 hypothetical protein [Alloactinosynnema sp. L-07]
MSRGRKPKKNKKAKNRPSQPRRQPRPDWFDQATAAVLDGAATLTLAVSPSDLQQRTAELVGEQLHWALYDIRMGLHFSRWFIELVAATDRARLTAEGDERLRLDLLRHGLVAIAPYTREGIVEAIGTPSPADGDGVPSWAHDTRAVQATGDVVRLVDTYGTRFGVIATYRYPGEADTSAYLFDVVSDSTPTLAGAGVYDDTAQAEAAWRAAVGESADAAVSRPVENGDELACLVDFARDLMGDETREVLNEHFRVENRILKLALALEERGIDLPDGEYFRGDHLSMAAEFTDWHVQRFGLAPDPDDVDVLADEWSQGIIGETAYGVSPGRARVASLLIGDMYEPDHARAAIALLPLWSTWLAERADLPAPLREQVLAAAEKAATHKPRLSGSEAFL